mgnify:CR=1 FL=1
MKEKFTILLPIGKEETAMDFRLTEEQTLLRKMIQNFAKKEVAPSAAQRDEEARFDENIVRKMAEIGIMGIPWPEKYGGFESDYVNFVIAVEELSRTCASTGVTLSAHTLLTSWSIYKYGTEEQKKTYLKRLATGELLGAFAISKSHNRNNVTSLSTTVKKDGESYILNGNTMSVINGGIADVYIVFAKNDTSSNHFGISACIVKKGVKGFTIGKKEKKLGIRSCPTTELMFENCRIRKQNILHEEEKGYVVLKTSLDVHSSSLAAQAVGIAQAALDAALQYAKERKQFGKPIVENQAISFKLANMATEIEAARLLTYQAAWLESNGHNSVKAASMAKQFACDVAMKATMEAVQIFGGYGYTKEFPVERYMRDAKMIQIYKDMYDSHRFIAERSPYVAD